jgi:AraC-like DNA-binding protein
MRHVCGVDAGDRAGGGGHPFLVGDEDDSGHRASVAAVGRMWGFSDAGHFARRFRAACGKCITGLAVSRTSA